MLTTVYRLEHPKTYMGPYNHLPLTPVRDRMLDDHHKDTNKPGGMKEFSYTKLLGLSQYVFGFATKEDLEWWFGKYLQPILKEGFVINTYESDHVIEAASKKQVLFKREPIEYYKKLVENENEKLIERPFVIERPSVSYYDVFNLYK